MEGYMYTDTSSSSRNTSPERERWAVFLELGNTAHRLRSGLVWTPSLPLGAFAYAPSRTGFLATCELFRNVTRVVPQAYGWFVLAVFVAERAQRGSAEEEETAALRP